jgi:hypothetical protein
MINYASIVEQNKDFAEYMILTSRGLERLFLPVPLLVGQVPKRHPERMYQGRFVYQVANR